MSASSILVLACLAQVPAGGETSRAEEFFELAGQEAAGYELTIGEAPGRTLTLRPEPVLRWTNPSVGEIYGGVYVWLEEGRPEALVSIFKWYDPFTHMTHEFQSLSAEPLVAAHATHASWKPAAAGVEFQDVETSAAPSAAANLRLAQMRSLAGQLSAWEVDKEGTRIELRLLRQPLLRYSSAVKDVVDGALFGFVHGTDPELLLLIEVQETDEGRVWRQAFARMNVVEMGAANRSGEVWHVDAMPNGDVYGRTSSYTKYHIGKVERR